MAKYTETFIEYINEDGNSLPSIFDEIEGFADLFTAHYCDREIGFETEILFKAKLEARANAVVPAYASRISMLATQYTKASNPSKIFYEKTTTTYGEQETKTTELPIDAVSAEPSLVNNAEQYENENEINREESGQNVDEVIKMLEYLNKQVKIVTDELLKEFESLFMQVY